MIDCDVRPPLGSVAELVPWLDPAFREYVLGGGYGGYALPSSPWSAPRGAAAAPAADHARMRERLLDPLGIEFAILTADLMLSVSAVPNGALAAALATAYNRWLGDEWLPRDERLRGSLLIAPQEPDRAAAEIRAAGGHPRIVQALVSCGAAAGYGDPRFEPIWAACAELGLPLALRAGAEGAGINAAPTATGYPATELELRALQPAAAMSHLASIAARGVLARHPGVRVAVVGCGADWVPWLLARIDAEAIADGVRFVVRAEEAAACASSIAGLLMPASGYPETPARWGDDWAGANARAFYGLPDAG